MPHNGWLEMAKPFISAFHAGADMPDSYIEQDLLIYWYRPTPKSVDCDSTDTCEQPWPSPSPNPNYFVGKPNGADTMTDEVFVVALLTQPGNVIINSGSKSKTFNAPAGASSWSLDMDLGKQSFAIQRGGQTVHNETSLKDIVDHCVCGIYNFNAYVGTVPAGQPDALQNDGLLKFATSLKIQCQAQPSLGTVNLSGDNIPATATTASTSPPLSSAMSSAQSSGTPPTPQSQSFQPSTSTAGTTPPLAPALGASKTITASEQIAPTNCLQPGYVWAGPAGQAVPDKCDG